MRASFAMVVGLCALLSTASGAVAAEEAPKPGVDAALATFDQGMKGALAANEDQDELCAAACEALSKKITLADLPKLEAFLATRTPEYTWVAMSIFADQKQLEPFVRLVTPVLAKIEGAENRRSHLWKVWEYRFNERKDFKELNAQIGLAFAKHYETVNATGRQVIADLFDRPVETPAEFRAFVEESVKRKKK